MTSSWSIFIQQLSEKVQYCVTQKVNIAGSIDLHVFTLKLEAATASELLVADYRLILCHIPPDSLESHHHEHQNLKQR